MDKDKRIIYLTDYDTVRGKQFEEISSKKFLKLLSKSVVDGGKFKRYKNYPNQFEVEIKDKEYILNLDKELLENIKKGIYTPFYKEFKRLYDQKIKDDKNYLLLSKAEYQISIGRKIDEESVPIYIQKQKENLSLSFEDIKEYFINFINDIKKSKKATSDFVNSKIWPFCSDDISRAAFPLPLATMLFGIVLLFLMTMIMIVSPFSVPLSISEIILILVGIGFSPTIVTYSIPLFTYIYMHIKNRIKRLNGFINQRKITKQKIKSLTQGNSKVILEDIAKIANDNSIENTDDKEHDSLRITKMILKEFDSIVKKIKNIKDENIQKEFLKKINDLFKEFNERLKSIEKVNNSLDLNLDGYQTLKKDMIVRLETINLELEEVMVKILRSEQISKLTSEFEQKLDKLNDNSNEMRKRGR